MPKKHTIFKKRKIVSFLCAVAMLAASFNCFPSSDEYVVSAATTSAQDKQTLKKYESNLSSLGDKLKDIQSQIAAAKAKLASAQETKALLDKEVENLVQQIETLDEVINGYNTQIETLDNEIIELQNKIDQNTELFRQCLIFSQENGDTEYIDFLLQSDSISDFLSRTEITNDIFEYQNKLINSLSEDEGLLESKKETVSAAKTLCEGYNAEYKQRKDELQVKLDESVAYIQQISEAQKENQQYEADILASRAKLESQIESMIAQIEKKEAEEKAAAEKDGSFYNPGFISDAGLQWPLGGRYTLTQRYGSYEMGSFHTGIDIATNRTPVPVYAAAAGKVITATSHYSYGNYVMINHGNGIVTLYAHLSTIGVSVGDVVKQGQKIGMTGTTGNSTGIHLHFMVYVNGKHTNPLNYVKQP